MPHSIDCLPHSFRWFVRILAALVVALVPVASALAQDPIPGRGPGINFDLCPFLSQEAMSKSS